MRLLTFQVVIIRYLENETFADDIGTMLGSIHEAFSLYRLDAFIVIMLRIP